MNAPYTASSNPWIKPLLLIGLLVALIMAALLIVQFQIFQPADGTRATWVPNAADTHVSFMPGDSERLYRFNANPTDVTLLKLNSETPGFTFAAEVRNSKGDTVAAFGGALENVQIELAPAEGLYQLAVAPADVTRSGTVMLSVGETQVTAVSTNVAYLPVIAPRCSVVNPNAADILVRSAPSDTFTVLGTLPQSTSLPALGHTDDGWIAANYREQQGWLRAEVTALNGDCTILPLILNPTIPIAPSDTQVYVLEVDRDGEGTFREVISAPQGDTNDLIWISVINLYTEPPNNFREFTLTLNCEGAALAGVRWGSAYSPTLSCGQSLNAPFMHGASQQPFMVLLPDGSRQSYARYTLSITPAGGVG